MADVIPLKNRNQYHHPQVRTPIKIRQQDDVSTASSDHDFYIGINREHVAPDVFCKNGRGVRDIHRLQAKYWPIVGFVDLHGCQQEEAQQILNQFIAYVQNRGVCGEIIHGSGLGSKEFTPVLKNMVRQWLMDHPQVLAYAQPNEHNDGAVLILLKQKHSKHRHRDDQ